MIFFRLAALLAGLAMAGCASGPHPPFAAQSSRSAGVEWRSAGRLFTARMAFETGARDDLRLVVSNDKPALTLTRRRGEWTASGLLVGGTWRGAWNTAPPSIAGWMSLAEAYEGAPFVPGGESEVRTGRFSVRYAKHGPELRAIELVAVATGDRYRVIFQAVTPR